MNGVSISTNYAATAAANNLALSNSMLQRSLNRLSSGSRLVRPSDDAGGTAVSMRLEALAKRSGSAATNINNGVSLLQNQEGALKTGGKILQRMAELHSLWNDYTKNDDDRGLYDIEFKALQNQLMSLTQEKFNDVKIFGKNSTEIVTTAVGDRTLTISAKGPGETGIKGVAFASLTGGAAPAALPINGTITINGVSISVAGLSRLEDIVNKINSVRANVTASTVDGGTKLKLVNNFYPRTDAEYDAGVVVSGSDEIGTARGKVDALLKLDAASTPTKTLGVKGLESRDGVSMLLKATGLGDLTCDGGGDLNRVITRSQNDFAAYRAANGAEQNGLGFAAELLVVNKANLESATGRINDVDVAQESTQLAKWTTLTQAGTAMLAQANQATALVLKLVGG